MLLPGRSNRGFSLVELMVSLVIGLIVVARLISVLMANRQAFTLQQSNNFNQENVRFAASRLAWSLRMADFWGGVKPDAISPTTNLAGIGGDGCDAAWVLSVGPGKQNGIFGYDGGDTFPIPNCVDDANYVKGSDVVVVRYADTTGYDPDKGAGTPAFDSTDPNVVPNQTSIFVVSGVGQQAALFRRGDAVPKSTLTTAMGRYVYPFQLEMYYLRPCADPGANGICDSSDDGGTPSPSLVRMRLDATGKPLSEVVVDGIEQLSFEYSWLAGPDKEHLQPVPFAKASDTQWPTVTQVRASFVARSTTRDTRVPHGDTFVVSPHCAYTIANDGAVTYPETTDTNLCKDQPAGTYGDSPQQYTRTLSSQIVLLRNRVRGMNMRIHSAPSAQRGIALFVGLIFLLVLSIVAVMAMKGTLVEMRMVTNSARHEAAFEASEALRAVPIALFDEHVFARGWPSSFNGDVPDSEFTYSSDIPAGMLAKVKAALQSDCSGKASLFFGTLQPACGSLPKETLYDATTWHPDMVIGICDTSSESCSSDVDAKVAVVPDGTVMKEGAGGAQAAGYRGLGIGAAAGGAEMYFEVKSVATAPGNGEATTHTQYQQTIRN